MKLLTHSPLPIEYKLRQARQHDIRDHQNKAHLNVLEIECVGDTDVSEVLDLAAHGQELVLDGQLAAWAALLVGFG
jgi:hypothetical protein